MGVRPLLGAALSQMYGGSKFEKGRLSRADRDRHEILGPITQMDLRACACVRVCCVLRMSYADDDDARIGSTLASSCASYLGCLVYMIHTPREA